MYNDLSVLGHKHENLELNNHDQSRTGVEEKPFRDLANLEVDEGAEDEEGGEVDEGAEDEEGGEVDEGAEDDRGAE